MAYSLVTVSGASLFFLKSSYFSSYYIVFAGKVTVVSLRLPVGTYLIKFCQKQYQNP